MDMCTCGPEELAGFLSDYSVVSGHAVQEHPVVLAELPKAVHLVEESDGVDFSPRSVLAGRKIVLPAIFNVDKASSGLEGVSRV